MAAQSVEDVQQPPAFLTLAGERLVRTAAHHSTGYLYIYLYSCTTFCYRSKP